MKTAGIDLATDDKNTAVCVVEWSAPGVRVDFRGDISDDCMVQLCRSDDVDKVGIDCPFG